MVSPEIRQAKSALLAKRKQLRDELTRVEQAIRALEGVIGTLPPPRKRSGGIKAAVEAVLREKNGEVMHADEIVEALKVRGVQLSAVDPKATVVTALLRMSRDGEVIALGRNRFQWSVILDHEQVTTGGQEANDAN